MDRFNDWRPSRPSMGRPVGGVKGLQGRALPCAC